MCGISALKILLTLTFFGLTKVDSKSSGIRKFLHISDIHYDINYKENGDDSRGQWCHKVCMICETLKYNGLNLVLKYYY